MHWRITAWELFATTIFLILEFYFLWSSSHIFTWIVATVTVAGSLFLAFPIPIGLTLATIAMAVGLGTVEFLPPMPLVETETHGWLVPANDPSPPNPCIGERPPGFSTPVPDSVFFFFGQMTVWAEPPTRNFIVLQIKGVPIIWAERMGLSLRVDADLFDQNGNLAARIRADEFHLVSGEYSYSERPDPSTLVVYDKRGEEVLFFRFLNPSAVRVRGRFFSKDGMPFTITDKEFDTPAMRYSSFSGCHHPPPVETTGLFDVE